MASEWYSTTGYNEKTNLYIKRINYCYKYDSCSHYCFDIHDMVNLIANY